MKDIKVKILIPQIVYTAKVVEVSARKLHELNHADDQNKAFGQFIWDHMDDDHRGWTEGEKWVERYMDNECISIMQEPKK